MPKISKILVPVDLSSCSRSALNQALWLASELGASVQVLYVTELPRFRTEPRIASENGNVTLRDYALAEAKAELAAFLEQSAQGQAEKVSTRVDVGSPRESILGHAKREAFDLIVMGTHGRTGRVHALAGSVAESVVRMAPCPVLTVRDAG
jgi:nucleotide-binding universal stress UspA family protein